MAKRDDLYSRNSLHGFVHKLRHYLRHEPEYLSSTDAA